jgi:hypothetical protein
MISGAQDFDDVFIQVEREWPSEKNISKTARMRRKIDLQYLEKK